MADDLICHLTAKYVCHYLDIEYRRGELENGARWEIEDSQNISYTEAWNGQWFDRYHGGRCSCLSIIPIAARKTKGEVIECRRQLPKKVCQ